MSWEKDLDQILSVIEHFVTHELRDYSCPACGQPSQHVINPEQAFCANDDCVLFMFNPSLWGKMYAGGLVPVESLAVESSET